MLMFKGIDMSGLTCMSQWYLNLKLQLLWDSSQHWQTHAAVNAGFLGVNPSSTVSCWLTHCSKIRVDANAEENCNIMVKVCKANGGQNVKRTLQMRKLLTLNLSTRGPSGDRCFQLELHGHVRILTFHLPRIHYVFHTDCKQMHYMYPEFWNMICKNLTDYWLISSLIE